LQHLAGDLREARFVRRPEGIAAEVPAEEEEAYEEQEEEVCDAVWTRWTRWT
jgi:hypothetical protein